jgi:hypothetical protein
MDWVPIVTSGLALLVSCTTAWLTLLRPGRLRMTQPTVVYLGPDGGPGPKRLKVYLRTLLYSTSRRGQTVESLHVSVQRGESKQNFTVWVHGDDKLVRGSGMFVGHDGVACNHHFLLPEDGSDFRILPGEHVLTVLGKTVDEATPALLAKVRLLVTDQHVTDLSDDQSAGIYFDWGADRQDYHPHVRQGREQPMPQEVLQALLSRPTKERRNKKKETS